jgi:hypothetical protein
MLTYIQSDTSANCFSIISITNRNFIHCRTSKRTLSCIQWTKNWPEKGLCNRKTNKWTSLYLISTRPYPPPPPREEEFSLPHVARMAICLRPFQEKLNMLWYPYSSLMLWAMLAWKISDFLYHVSSCRFRWETQWLGPTLWTCPPSPATRIKGGISIQQLHLKKKKKINKKKILFSIL